MIVYTVGTFDLLHVGHIALLEYCKSLGDTLVVGVASDEVVKSYKPNLPVIPLDQRRDMLKALRCVDIVRPYHELEYVSACRELKVDIFVIGEDWGKNQHNLDVERFIRSEGSRITQIHYDPRTSSTQIKKDVVAQTLWAKHSGKKSHDRDEKEPITITVNNRATMSVSKSAARPAGLKQRLTSTAFK